MSSDGRYVAFYSSASNLVSGDSNGYSDVFLHDQQTGQTTRVSVATDGTQGNNTIGNSTPAISADGRYVVFVSTATNMVADDTNGSKDVFVHDQQTGQTTRVSVASDGTQSNADSWNPSISGDGHYVSFNSNANNLVSGDTNGYSDIFVHDMQTGQTTRVSIASDGTQGDSASYASSFSDDGRYVVFDSASSNLVSDDTNNTYDTFVYDQQTGQVTRVSIASDDTQGNDAVNYDVPSISTDGRYVAFVSFASNLVGDDTNGVPDVFVHDRGTAVLENGTISGMIYDSNGVTPITANAWAGALSADNGNWVADAGVNPDGTYSIVLPPGDYRVFANSDTSAREFYNNANHYDDATIVTVVENTDTPDIDFVLDPGGSISGTVTDDEGNPLENINVGLDSGWTTGACTDADGQYTLTMVPLNTPYGVFAGGDNWCEGGPNTYVQEWWQEKRFIEEATAVTVSSPGADIPGIDFTLTLTGTITGTVYESDGETPITTTAGVTAEDINTGDYVNGTDLGSDGTYRLRLPPGTYRLYAWAYGYAQDFYDGLGPIGENATPVIVTSGAQTPGIDFRLDFAGTISGTVVNTEGDPLENMNVGAEGAWIGACTDANGQYILYGVPVDTPLVVYSGGDNWCGGGSELYLQEWWQDAYTYETATPITLTLAERDQSGFDFTLVEGGRISGFVRETGSGIPIAGAWISVEEVTNGWWLGGAETGADGSYTVVRIPPLDVRVRADAGGYAFEYYDNAGQNGDTATSLSIRAGTETPNIDFALEPGGTISGTVYDENGMTPLANMMVDVEGHWVGTCTDSEGHFTLSSLPLDEPLVVFSGGDNWCDGGSKLYLPEWWQDAYSYDMATPVTLTLAGRDQSGIDFTLVEGGRISGFVHETDGITPIAGAWISVEEVTNGWWLGGTETEADGSYTVLRIPPLNVRVRADAGGHAFEYYDNAGQNGDTATPLSIAVGTETPNIDFTLAAGGTISGTVYDENGMTPLANMMVDVEGHWVGTCTDSEGHFTLYSLPVGEPLVVFSGGDNWCDGGSKLYRQEWWQDTHSYESATPITLTLVQRDRSGINFILDEGGSMTGLVTAAESGDPLSGVGLCAFDYAAPAFDLVSGWECTQTGEDGTYVLSRIPPGSKRVWIFPEDRLRLFYPNSSTFEGAAPVVVSAGSTTAGIDFSLPLAGIIRGMVYAHDGVTPLAGVTLSTGDGEYPECSQTDGSYRIFVPAGSHIVKASAGMCNSQVTVVTDYYDNVPDIGDATAVPISIGETVDSIDFVMSVLPAGPTLIAPSSASRTNNNTPTFVWQGVDFGETYEIQITDNDNFDSPLYDVTGSELSYTVPDNLVDGVTYSWQVRAFNSRNDAGAWSDVWNVLIDSARPGVPVLSSPKDRTVTPDTTPRLVWKAVRGATQYRLQIAEELDFGSPVDIGIDTIAATSYTIPDLNALPYGVYYWRVQAQDASGNLGDWSYVNTVTITILNWPKNAQYLTDTTPTLQWLSGGYGVVYDVQVDEAGGDFSGDLPFSYNGTARSATTPELAHGDYQWRARANGGAWTPAWTFTVTPPTTIAPKLTTPTNYARLDMTTPAFAWQPVSGGEQYQIQISTSGNFKTPVQDVTFAPSDPLHPTFNAAALADGGKYFWRVRAINSVGVAGAWSAKWQFTLNQLVRPVLLDPPSGTPTTNTAPQLRWNGLSDALSYEIQIDTDQKFGTPDQLLTATAPDTSATPAPLPDGRYFWRVRGVNAFGVTGLWSVAWNFTVDTTGPEQPVLRSPADHAGTRDTTPTLVWRSARTAKQYHVLVAEDTAFTDLKVDVTVGGTSYTIPALNPLDYGVHYWQVQAIDALGNPGDWSTPFQFALTIMTNPKDGTATTALRPTFAWAAVPGALSYHFELADNPAFTTPLAGEYEGPNRSYVPPVALATGAYYWRVSVDGGDPLPTWTLIITPAKPTRPILSAPANRTLTNDNTPIFNWLPATNGDTYQIQIDNNADFSSPEQDVTVGVESYIAGTLPDGRYYWRVRAFNSDTAPGAWSAAWQVTVDTLAPPVPALLAPVDGASSTNRMLKLTWTKVNGAVAYELHLDLDDTFPLPVISVGNKTTYTPPTPLSRAIYSWQVRAIDKAGNASAWGEVRTFEIVAGVTAPTVEPLTPLPVAPVIEPTLEPTVEPTVVPTIEPTATLEPALITVESDDPGVQRSGNWTGHPTEPASGGGYLYSSGSPNDTLSLSFAGSRVDVIYVMHPALGSFALVLDDVPVQTVSSTAPDTVFGARVSLNVAAGPHTLHIVPVSGVIAIDAFAVEVAIEPTEEPTVEPTVEPTSEPITEPTVEPTAEPTSEPIIQPIIEPTATPLPALLPLVEPFETGTGWTPDGAWRFDSQNAYGDGGWFADSAARGQSSTLTADVAIDLRTAQNPELTVWQRASLSSGDGIALDVSVDGGQSWLPVDQQPGTSFDWLPRTVSLAAYRGQIVRLRFRLDTLGAVPDGEPSVGWWIDDLTVQDVTVMPPTATPLPTEVPTETPLPTATPTEVPTATPLPTMTPTDTPLPTDTPVPTMTPTDVPTSTLQPEAEPPQDPAATPDNG
jgi:hypothetical protein